MSKQTYLPTKNYSLTKRIILTSGGGHVAGSVPDSQGEDGLPGHWPRGSDVEGSGGDFKSPARSLH